VVNPEQRATQEIDRLLSGAGGAVQSMAEVNLAASAGVAIREFPLNPGAATSPTRRWPTIRCDATPPDKSSSSSRPRGVMPKRTSRVSPLRCMHRLAA